MVNLMSVDAQRLMTLMTYIQVLWSAPLQITVAVYFLYNTMGVSIFAGVAVMILLIPLSVLGTRLSGKLQVALCLHFAQDVTYLTIVINPPPHPHPFPPLLTIISSTVFKAYFSCPKKCTLSWLLKARHIRFPHAGSYNLDKQGTFVIFR